MGLPKAFYINLDASEDRRKGFEAQVKEYGVFAARFAAVSSSEIDNYVHDWKWTNLKPTEVACLVSHLELIRQHGSEEIMVFEDDVSFEPMNYWGFTLENALNVIPKEWSVVQLASFPPVSMLAYTKWDIGKFGTVAYLIRPERAQELVNKGYRDGKWDLHGLPSRYSRPLADSVIYSYANAYSIPLFGIRDVPSVIQASQPHGHFGQQLVNRWKSSSVQLQDL